MNKYNQKSTVSVFAIALSVVLLAGCLPVAKFNATDEVTIKESIKKVSDSLPEGQRAEFADAVTYFAIGGTNGLRSMIADAFSGKASEAKTETTITVNLQSIHGLNGEEILAKYRASLEDDREREAEEEKVSSLKKEAEKLLESNQFEDALAKYEAMGEISSGVESAKAGVRKTTDAMKNFTEKMNYIDKVQITEFVAKRIDTYLKKGVPAVRIALKNTGGRSLDKVEVTVYFMDKDGNAIFEEDFHPVLVSKYSFSGDNKPLKPGYVKEMEKGNYYTIKSQLSEWFEGKATAKITDIKFSK